MEVDLLAEVRLSHKLKHIILISYSVPIGTVAITVLYFVWPGSANVTDVVDVPSFRRLDFLGAILSAITSIGFVYCIEQVGTK